MKRLLAALERRAASRLCDDGRGLAAPGGVVAAHPRRATSTWRVRVPRARIPVSRSAGSLRATDLFGALTLTIAILGCPRGPPSTTLGGGDDDRMDAIAAQLEEHHSRSALSCADSCDLKSKVCGLAREACEIAAHAENRADHQQRCLAAGEACARFSDSCARCAR